jgi:DNA-binding response OmpR family regulator
MKEAALKAGANDFLAKPFSIGQLLSRIQTVVDH